MPSIAVKDPSKKEQEEEDVLKGGGAVCRWVSVFKDGWSSFSRRRSIGIKYAGTLRYVSEFGLLTLVSFLAGKVACVVLGFAWKDLYVELNVWFNLVIFVFWFILFLPSFGENSLGRMRYGIPDVLDELFISPRNDNSGNGKHLDMFGNIIRRRERLRILESWNWDLYLEEIKIMDSCTFA